MGFDTREFIIGHAVENVTGTYREGDMRNLSQWQNRNRFPNTADVSNHDDVIKRKHFPRYWPFVRGIHRSSMNSPHKDQWCGALMFSLICVWINGWVNNREAGDLKRYRGHYDVTVMNESRSNRRKSCPFLDPFLCRWVKKEGLHTVCSKRPW